LPYEIKTYFFIVVSFLVVSGLILLVESFIFFVLSGAGAIVLFVLSFLSEELPLSLQAANAPIAKTNRIFFIVPFFGLINDLGLIPEKLKGNPVFQAF